MNDNIVRPGFGRRNAQQDKQSALEQLDQVRQEIEQGRIQTLAIVGLGADKKQMFCAFTGWLDHCIVGAVHAYATKLTLAMMHPEDAPDEEDAPDNAS